LTSAKDVILSNKTRVGLHGNEPETN